MKKGFAIVLLITVIFVFQGYADLIELSGSGSWIMIDYAEPIGQSFVAEDSEVDFVGFNVGDENQHCGPTDLTIEIKVFSGAGDFTSSALMYSGEVTLTDNYSGWADLDVSSLDFTVGNNYTIAAYNENERWGVHYGSDRYAGGTGYVQGNAVPSLDLDFHVIPASPVPEPSSLSLILFGLVGLIGAGVRKKD